MRKLKIFDVPWHLAHQFEMLKFPFAEWSWLRQWKREYVNIARGDMEKMFSWVPYYEPGKYDVAILHLDQQCVEPGILAVGKGMVYRHLNEVIKDIPKIVIMHGTPYNPEAQDERGNAMSTEYIINKVNELLGDNYLVVNSHKAAEQWKRGKVIIHGMNAGEWRDLPKEPRVVTMISPGGMPSYYDRTFLEHVREGLAEKDITHCHITVDFNAKDWDEYRNFLGRSLIYFNPTRESPMPRSRTEAMLSGCCVLTTPHQDAGSFIKEGVNGFLVPRNADYVVDLVQQLFNDPERALEIGQRGKQTALELFSQERYQQEWEDYLKFVISDWRDKKNGNKSHITVEIERNA